VTPGEGQTEGLAAGAEAGSTCPPYPPRPPAKHSPGLGKAARPLGFHNAREAAGRGRHGAAQQMSYCWDSRLGEQGRDKIKPVRAPHVAADPAFII